MFQEILYYGLFINLHVASAVQ